jgi:hypothetical protein
MDRKKAISQYRYLLHDIKTMTNLLELHESGESRLTKEQLAAITKCRGFQLDKIRRIREYCPDVDEWYRQELTGE